MSVSANIPFRICIVSEQLADGGAERCSALLSQYLEKNNCYVHHVIVIDKIEYDYAGKILNLGKLKSESFNLFDRISRFKVLYQFFRKNKFDFIIDTRVINRKWQEFFIIKFVYNAPFIKMVHSFMTNLYFPKNSFLAKSIYSKSFKIISVSKAIEEKIKNKYHYKQVKTIYNPIDIAFINRYSKENMDVNYDYILAVGNMNTNVKQFDKLIDCYSKSNLPNSNIKLLIIGDGKLKANYEKQVSSLNLQDFIYFKGKIDNPFPFYKGAIYTILTSSNEGFPTVLLESLACETPIISFDCQSGPNEIIVNNQNGILVENQNQHEMINAMNEMIINKKLYLHCKNNAKASVEKYAVDAIGNQWLQLFNTLKK